MAFYGILGDVFCVSGYGGDGVMMRVTTRGENELGLVRG